MHPGQPTDTGTEPGCPDLTTRQRAKLAHSKVPTLSERLAKTQVSPTAQQTGLPSGPTVLLMVNSQATLEQPGTAFLGKEPFRLQQCPPA